MRGRRTAAQAAAGSDFVVVILPLFRQHLRFIQIAKQLTVQKLIPHPIVEALAIAVPAVETLAIAVLPGAAWLNAGGDDARV